MLKTIDLYIDLGTVNTLIYGKGKGLLLNEPSVLALRHHAGTKSEVFASGRVAKTMIGKNHKRLSIHRPLREGVIADFTQTAQMLSSYMQKIKNHIRLFKPRMIISLPCQVTHHEKTAVKEVGRELGAKRVHLLDEPVAAAVGAGLRVLGHRGQMVIDIGGGTTEIAVISLGGIITSTAVRIGGDKIDERIIEHLRNRYHFFVGEQTAERLKIKVTNINPMSPANYDMQVGGLDLITGLPKRLRVTSEMLREPILSVVNEITQAARQTLEKCPPEIAGDIMEFGMTIAGGGALLRGLKQHLQHQIGVPIHVANNALLSVAHGGAKALEDSKLLDLLENPR